MAACMVLICLHVHAGSSWELLGVAGQQSVCWQHGCVACSSFSICRQPCKQSCRTVPALAIALCWPMHANSAVLACMQWDSLMHAHLATTHQLLLACSCCADMPCVSFPPLSCIRQSNRPTSKAAASQHRPAQALQVACHPPGAPKAGAPLWLVQETAAATAGSNWVPCTAVAPTLWDA